MNLAEQVHGKLTLGVFNDGTAYLGPPDWYYHYTGNLVIRTPYATDIVYGKKHGDFPIEGSRRMFYRHYVDPKFMAYPEVRNPELDPDRISFKRFGEPVEVYRVVVDDRRDNGGQA